MREGLKEYRSAFKELLLKTSCRERKLLSTIMTEHNIPLVDLLIMELDKREWFVLNKLMRFSDLRPRIAEAPFS